MGRVCGTCGGEEKCIQEFAEETGMKDITMKKIILESTFNSLGDSGLD